MSSVTAIIPAFNEENTIGGIVKVLSQITEVKEIIVVSDGSADNTAERARAAGAKVIELQENVGKGGAMSAGVAQAQYEVILFLDADLIGLTPTHVRDMLDPVLKGAAAMSIGIFEKGRLATDLAQVVAPYLSGQRVLRKDLLRAMRDVEDSGFGVEVTLTKYAHDHHLKVQEVELAGMTHIMKEEKLGFKKGLQARMKMYWQIAKAVGIGLKHKNGYHDQPDEPDEAVGAEKNNQ
ncbi:glycosyltransferase family 2 protein [Dehalobacterium formicoaceticum]|uniref:Glucosyl-3-phosphoglycerate synthase n=1 Tax=Dehalobacterium formicoaceticum TaxID=51515 RepID=A0ABT1Y1G1_9FIRM|nr:glycosyltransferase family 2 protein [Dehalobacterium formicoaceticum]MCR6544709.1 glycosyltransferase family 2 protein [Dehalobacterium formicoaceticum]